MTHTPESPAWWIAPVSVTGVPDAATAVAAVACGVSAPEDPLSSEPDEADIFAAEPPLTPFSLSLRFEDDRRTKRLSLSLSERRRRSRELLLGPLPPALVGNEAGEPAGKFNE